jgi:hypothetical protein
MAAGSPALPVLPASAPAPPLVATVPALLALVPALALALLPATVSAGLVAPVPALPAATAVEPELPGVALAPGCVLVAGPPADVSAFSVLALLPQPEVADTKQMTKTLRVSVFTARNI